VFRIGLVLGAGGTTGLAFHAGVLAALQEASGWDPRRAEVVVGTSAGSLSGSLLRLGLSAGDLRCYTESLPLSPEGVALAELGAPHRPRAHLGDFLRPRPPTSVGAVVRGLLSPWSRHPLVTASAVLPVGPVPTSAISEGIDRVAGGRWPQPDLWIAATRLRDGRRVVFGRDGSPRADLGQAVAASCAIPAYFRPVAIGPDRYVDGGVVSIHSLDLLAGTDLDLVIVSAPMSAADNHLPAAPDTPLRRLVKLQLDREEARLRARGTPVLVLAPTRSVRTAMGLDALDARRRGLVSRLARNSALAHLQTSGFLPLLADAAGSASRRSASPAA